MGWENSCIIKQEVPARPIGSADPEEHGVDQFAKGRFRRGGAGEGPIDDSVFRSADGMPEDFGVEFQLVAEMVVDQSDVGAGAGADLADGGGLESGFGEDLTGGVEEFGARVLGQRGRYYGGGFDFRSGAGHVNRSLKRTFNSVKAAAVLRIFPMLGSLCFAFFSFFFLAWGARGKLSGAAGLRIFRLSVVIGLFLRPTISTAARKIGVAGGRRGGWNQRGKTAGVDLAGVEIYLRGL